MDDDVMMDDDEMMVDDEIEAPAVPLVRVGLVG